MTKLNLLGLSVVTIGLLVGCGSSDTPTTGGSDVQTGTGYYVDSAVNGVDYVCGTQTGTTDSEGKFTFETGKDCTFSVAGVPLRTTKADDLVDGQKVVENNITVAQFLQSIDNDGDPSNGIQIEPAILTFLTQALTAHSAGKVPTGTVLDTVVASVRDDVPTFEGRIKTAEEVTEHLTQTQTEITKELLAGKTFYHVGVNIDGTVGSLEKYVVNATATVMTYSCIEGCEDNSDNGSTNVTIVGNSIVFDGGDTATLTKKTSDYLLFEDNYGKHYSYATEAKAKAFYDSLTTAATPSALSDLIVGKTLYQHCKDASGDWITTLTFNTNGDLLIVDNDYTETIKYRIDGNTVYTTEDGVENAHSLLEQTTDSITVQDNDGTTTFYFDRAKAEASVADDCSSTLITDLVSGHVTFKDLLSVPSDAWVRIVPSINQKEGNYEGPRCKIDNSGNFGNECYIDDSIEDVRKAFSDSESFQVVVFKNHIEPNKQDWDCGENVYKYVVGNSWTNIEVLSSDFEDRSQDECNNN